MTGCRYRAPSYHIKPELMLRIGCSGLAFAVFLMCWSPVARSVTQESPEVRELVDKGLEFLEKRTDSRLGGKCLVALAFLTNGASPNHHRVGEALSVCDETSTGAIRQ